MNVVLVIPARMKASRLPGKPMKPILGIPLIEHCYHRACKAVGSEAVYIATCDQEIESHANGLGGQVIMTSADHTRATTRTAEALEIIESTSNGVIDIVIMFQGDEPFIPPETIADIVKHFADPNVEVVNVMSEIKSMEAFEDRNNVKVTVKENNDALYFSRAPIPCQWTHNKAIPMYLQTGLIAFRRKALLAFNQMTETTLEIAESIDMNRLIERNKNVRMVLTENFTMGVDTEQDLIIASQRMLSDPSFKSYS